MSEKTLEQAASESFDKWWLAEGHTHFSLYPRELAAAAYAAGVADMRAALLKLVESSETLSERLTWRTETEREPGAPEPGRGWL